MGGAQNEARSGRARIASCFRGLLSCRERDGGGIFLPRKLYVCVRVCGFMGILVEKYL